MTCRAMALWEGFAPRLFCSFRIKFSAAWPVAYCMASEITYDQVIGEIRARCRLASV